MISALFTTNHFSLLFSSLPSVSSLFILLISVLCSGVLRGFTGFGSALFAVPILSLFMAPLEAASVVMGFQVLSGLQTLSSDWEYIDTKSIIPLCLAGSLASILGSILLVNMSPQAAKLIMGVIILIAVFCLTAGWRFKKSPDSFIIASVGTLSGLLNGFSAMGGAPLIVYFLSGPYTPQTARATMTCIFMLQGAVSLASVVYQGATTLHTFILIIAMFPFLAIGTGLGTWAFRVAPPFVYRWVAIATLSLLAIGIIIQTSYDRFSHSVSEKSHYPNRDYKNLQPGIESTSR